MGIIDYEALLDEVEAPPTVPWIEHEAEEAASNPAHRPTRLAEVVGQLNVRENLAIQVQAAKARQAPLDHLLFYGPPGLGKTTLSLAIASEMGVPIKVVTGPAIERAGDLAAMLAEIQARQVLFIDEIHRLPRQVEEILYPAMEDFALDLVIGKGANGARTVRLDLPPFTVVGATTRLGMLSAPLQTRFGSLYRLDFYTESELAQVISRVARHDDVPIEPDALTLLAGRARGTPRVALRLYRRARDYAIAREDGVITEPAAQAALTLLEIDPAGLTAHDRAYLGLLIHKFDGGPTGLKTLAAALGDSEETLEDVVEPYLLRCGLIERTARGRTATRHGYGHLGVAFPEELADISNLIRRAERARPPDGVA